MTCDQLRHPGGKKKYAVFIGDDNTIPRYTLPETNSKSTLKMDGWKTMPFPFGARPICSKFGGWYRDFKKPKSSCHTKCEDRCERTTKKHLPENKAFTRVSMEVSN